MLSRVAYVCNVLALSGLEISQIVFEERRMTVQFFRAMPEFQLHVYTGCNAETVHHILENTRIQLDTAVGPAHIFPQTDGDADFRIQFSAYRNASTKFQ